MRTLFGSPVGRGTAIPSFTLGDLLVGASSSLIGDAASGILRRACLRCVLGLLLRTRGFVELMLVVDGVVGAPKPSVAVSLPSDVGNVPPFINF